MPRSVKYTSTSPPTTQQRKRDYSGEGGLEQLRLLDLVGVVRARCRRRGRRSGDAAQCASAALQVGKELGQVERDERPRALVGRLLLHPHDVLGRAVAVQRRADLVSR